ncbi:RlpA-like double-psi beta-barrel-protein domain-containing protein-containing protein [Absidia repens]|uniref:RlpA-like double-psi beta-barrel-protein domain-containing protein-containing protein n=1 Tax=Absidia repens TaxID=90262 RepID=A0A1X2J223_9FUNG|nr:RlpA-like double-psi beta-barrel-protein domain-containing protein-containing protein [Absidia repens]
MHFFQTSVIFLALVVVSISALPLPRLVTRDSQGIEYSKIPQGDNHSNLITDLDSAFDSAKSIVYTEDDDEDFDHDDSTTSTTPTTSSSTATTTTTVITTTTTSTSSKTKTKTSTSTTSTPTSSPTTSKSSSGSSGSNSGRGTFYNPNLGSCGKTNSDSEMVVALNAPDMANGANSNNNPKCGEKIEIHYESKSVVATIVDTCPSCDKGALDMSPAVFAALADLDLGVIKVTWDYI